MSPPSFDIPKECKAGVVVDEGPNFRVEVKMVPVPEIGIVPLALLPVELNASSYLPSIPKRSPEFLPEVCPGVEY